MPALKVADVPALAKLWDVAKNAQEGLSPTSMHANASQLCWWRCAEGHSYQRLAISKHKNLTCQLCSKGSKLASSYEKSLAHLYPQLAQEWASRNALTAAEVTPGSGRNAHWLCSNNHLWEAKVGSRTKRKLTCPYCAHLKVWPGFNDLATMRPTLAKELVDADPSKVKFNTRKSYLWRCSEGHEWQAPVNNRSRDGKRKGSNCARCSKRVSRGENELADFVESKGFVSVRSSRDIIKPYELDVFIPGLKIALEFNGVYWHSDEQIKSTRNMSSLTYHNMKKAMCKEQSIDLFFIWQDDWELNVHQVKEALTDLLIQRKTSDILQRLTLERT